MLNEELLDVALARKLDARPGSFANGDRAEFDRAGSKRRACYSEFGRNIVRPNWMHAPYLSQTEIERSLKELAASAVHAMVNLVAMSYGLGEIGSIGKPCNGLKSMLCTLGSLASVSTNKAVSKSDLS